MFPYLILAYEQYLFLIWSLVLFNGYSFKSDSIIIDYLFLFKCDLDSAINVCNYCDSCFRIYFEIQVYEFLELICYCFHIQCLPLDFFSFQSSDISRSCSCWCWITLCNDIFPCICVHLNESKSNMRKLSMLLNYFYLIENAGCVTS